MKVILICLGGFIGAVFRYLCSIALSKFFTQGSFSWAILIINFTGSFLFGTFQSLLFTENFSSFLFIGVFGAFTTFSTFSMEAVQLWQQNLYKKLLLYICLSMIGSPILFSLGYFISE